MRGGKAVTVGVDRWAVTVGDAGGSVAVGSAGRGVAIGGALVAVGRTASCVAVADGCGVAVGVAPQPAALRTAQAAAVRRKARLVGCAIHSLRDCVCALRNKVGYIIAIPVVKVKKSQAHSRGFERG